MEELIARSFQQDQVCPPTSPRRGVTKRAPAFSKDHHALVTPRYPRLPPPPVTLYCSTSHIILNMWDYPHTTILAGAGPKGAAHRPRSRAHDRDPPDFPPRRSGLHRVALAARTHRET